MRQPACVTTSALDHISPPAGTCACQVTYNKKNILKNMMFCTQVQGQSGNQNLKQNANTQECEKKLQRPTQPHAGTQDLQPPKNNCKKSEYYYHVFPQPIWGW